MPGKTTIVQTIRADTANLLNFHFSESQTNTEKCTYNKNLVVLF